LGKRHYKTLCFLEMYFPPTFFTTLLTKEIKLHGLVFLHQMYEYERFNGILKSLIKNQAYSPSLVTRGGS
jgi:hypothetical protein